MYLNRGNIALIRSQNVYNNGFHRVGLVFVTEKHAAELANVEVKQGDVLLNITGDSVARSCQVDPSILPARVNQHVALIRPDPAKLSARFLHYFLVSPGAQAALLSLAAAGGTRNALTKAMIESFEVIAPSDITEQHALADILGTLDDKIELNRRMNETLEAMARAIFKSWFVDFDPVRAKAEGRDPGLPKPIADLFPDRFEGELPKGWGTDTLARYAILNPESWSKGSAPDEIAYVDLANVKWGRIERIQRCNFREAPSRAQRVLSPGDTIVGTVRPGNGSFSLIAEPGLTASTGFAVLRPRKLICEEYVYLVATSPENIERLSYLADGAAYPAVRPDVVLTTPAIRPSEDVLRSFSEFVKHMMERIAANWRESETLAVLRDTLLPKLISGEIRVTDAERTARRYV